MKQLNFDLLTRTAGSWEGGGDGAAGKTQLLAFCCIRDSLQINIQHDHVLKKLNFDLLTPPPESGGGCRGVLAKYLLQCCCSHNIHLNCYTTWRLEKVEF